MSVKFAWWKQVCPTRWRSARGTASVGQAHTQPKSKEVLLARLQLLELTGNSINSPFHGCHLFWLLLLNYVSLIVGGVVALPWLIISCWPMWGLRMIFFSWGGFSSLFDLFCLPRAVAAFQQRSRQEYVTREIRKRLRAALEGLNFAAFLGESTSADNDYSEGRNTTCASPSSSSNSSSTNVGVCKELQLPSNCTVNSNETETCQNRQGKQEQQGGSSRVDDTHGSVVAAVNGSSNVLRRRSTRILQQRMRQETADNAVDGNRTAVKKTQGVHGSEAPSKTPEPHLILPSDMSCLEESKQAGLTISASVKEELQHADLLRQQRAAAAVEASAAANARRLGLTTLADCQRLAGKEALTDVDVEWLLQVAHVEPELLTFPDHATAGHVKTSQNVLQSWLARLCYLPLYRTFRNIKADCPTPVSFPSPPRTAASAASAASLACTVDNSDLGGRTTADVPCASLSSDKKSSAGSPVSPEVAKTSMSCVSSEIGPCKLGYDSLSSGATPCDSCPATGTLNQDGDENSSGSSNSHRSPVRCLSDGASTGKEDTNAVKDGGTTPTAGRRTNCNSDEKISSIHHTPAKDEENTDSRIGENWKQCKQFIPWQLILRGLIAHIECTYVLDLLFCHAQLSPLTNSVQRILLLLLHCLIRGLTISLTFASPYAYIPYSSSLLARHLTYCVFMCIATSFAATACLALAPVLIEDLLQPLLRFLMFPKSVVDSDVLLVFVDLRVLLPSVPLHYQRTTWSERIRFYAASQIVTLAVITVGAYTAVRLYDAKPRAAAAARLAYAKDVLTLLALGEREKSGDGMREGMTPSTTDNASPLVADGQSMPERAAISSVTDSQHRHERAAASPTGKVPFAELQVVNRGSKVAGTAGLSNESPPREKARTLVSLEGGKGSSEQEEHGRMLNSTSENAEISQREPEEDMQQVDGSMHEQSQWQKWKEGMKEDGLWNLLLAEKIIKERMYLEASNFDLVRSRLLRRLSSIAAVVVGLCVLVCWTSVAFLAVSNVAMRVNTPSDVLQEKNNVKLMAAVAAAVSLFDDQAGEGLQDWAEDLRLLQEELRDVLAHYSKIQQERGWMEAMREAWGKLREEFAAAEEPHAKRRNPEMSAYTVLGVKPSATSADIKKAYKILAKQLHPDILTAATSDKPATPEELDLATERMRQINAAYEKLMRKHGGRAGKSIR